MDWWRVGIAGLLGLTLLFAGCSGSASEATSTTGAEATTSTTGTSIGTDTTGGSGSGGTGAGGTTDTTGPASTTTTAPEVADYSIESRTAGEGGDTLVILLPAGTYSDLDLENIVVDVVDRFAPVITLHVVDDSAVVPLVLQPRIDLTAADRELVDEHYFVRLEEGFRLVYEGPFVSVGEVILGS